MLGLEIVVAVGAAVLAGSVLSRRLGVSAPIVLVALGVTLTALPGLRDVGLPSETVLLLFLPALLYWESLTTSMREIRRLRRGILISGTALVGFTAAVVAAVAHVLGLSWGTAWILGAAVAPTDATAVAALGRLLPLRSMTTLRAESLINDGTALVIYGLAVGYATSHEAPGAGEVAFELVRSFGGALIVAAIVGWAVGRLRARVRDAVHHNLLMFLTPFAVYLLAEMIHASGVVAVVAVGLYMSQLAPRIVSARVRALSTPFWQLSTTVLNGALFVLVGMQLPTAVRSLTSTGLVRGMLVTMAVWATTLAGRWVFLNLSIVVIRALDRSERQRSLRTTPRTRLVSTLAGFRGAVSLAVALSVPESFTGGGLPARDMIVFVTAGVVVNSLLFQGLALPRVVAWAQLPDDCSEEEQRKAVAAAKRAALEALPDLAAERGTPTEIVEEVRREYERALTDPAYGGDDEEASTRQEQYDDLRLALLGTKRATVVRLRDQRVIDDTVLRRLQAHMDLEEVRLLGPLELE